VKNRPEFYFFLFSSNSISMLSNREKSNNGFSEAIIKLDESIPSFDSMLKPKPLGLFAKAFILG
jgi:hypothetical protein